MISETTELVLVGDVWGSKWTYVGFMFHSLGISAGLSPRWSLNWFIFILRLGGRNLGTRMMHSYLILLYNYSTALENSLLLNVWIFNNCLDIFCIIVYGILCTKIIREMTRSGQGIRGSNHIYITTEFMNVSPCVDI